MCLWGPQRVPGQRLSRRFPTGRGWDTSRQGRARDLRPPGVSPRSAGPSRLCGLSTRRDLRRTAASQPGAARRGPTPGSGAGASCSYSGFGGSPPHAQAGRPGAGTRGSATGSDGAGTSPGFPFAVCHKYFTEVHKSPPLRLCGGNWNACPRRSDTAVRTGAPVSPPHRACRGLGPQIRSRVHRHSAGVVVA